MLWSAMMVPPSYFLVYVDLPVTNGRAKNYFTVTVISYIAAQNGAANFLEQVER